MEHEGKSWWENRKDRGVPERRVSWNMEGGEEVLSMQPQCLSFHSFMPHIFIMRLLCARHLSHSEPAKSAYMWNAAAAAKSLQSYLTLCNPIDGSPPGSPTPGILQARTLEWVAISFSSAWKWKVKAKLLSRVRLAATPGTTAYQAPLSMGFSRQEYWSGLPLPSPCEMMRSRQ